MDEREIGNGGLFLGWIVLHRYFSRLLINLENSAITLAFN